MNYTRPMLLELTGQEVALVVTGLMELPGKTGSYDLVKRIEAIDAELERQAAKVPGPELKMVSQP
jgi:hypothetical protein